MCIDVTFWVQLPLITMYIIHIINFALNIIGPKMAFREYDFGHRLYDHMELYTKSNYCYNSYLRIQQSNSVLTIF